jgi:hypothetical protein
MKIKPLVLTFECLFFLTVGFSIPLQVMSMYEHDLMSWRVMAAQITPYNWLVILTSFFNAYLSYHGHSLLKLSIPLSFILVLLNNIQVATHEVHAQFSVPWLASLGYLIMTVVFTFSEAHRRLMMDQTLRWWKSAVRAKDKFDVMIAHPGENPINLQSYDISTGGLYLDCSNPMNSEWKNYRPGDKVLLYFRLPNGSAFNCTASVVRQCTSTRGNYPTGLGLKLSPMRIEQKRNWLARVQEQIRKNAENVQSIGLAA